MIYDFAIIGGGVSGAFIAREMMKYKHSVILLEKESDIGTKTTSANSGIIHGGYDAVPRTLKAKLNVLGNQLMDEVKEDLNIAFDRIGSLVIAFDDEGVEVIENLYYQGIKNGVSQMKIIDMEEIKRIEPNINHNVKKALLCESAGIVYPFEMCQAAMENAVDNGLVLKCDYDVTSITKKDGIFNISNKEENIEARCVINAAGVFADKIARMLGDDDFEITPRKGEYLLFDKTEEDKARHVIFQTPSKMGKGVLVSRTTDGNLLVGPNANDIDDKEDLATTKSGLDEIKNGALRSLEKVDYSKVITTFAGLRAVCDRHDFIIEESKKVKNFIHVAGIESPGLSSAPAIGLEVVEVIKKMGKDLTLKPDFIKKRNPFRRFAEMTPKELEEARKDDPRYTNIICRCEKVSEAEIVDAINRSAGARTLDGIKRRTRAQMGRCQGGFCMPLIMKILERELNIESDDINKSGKGSYITCGEIKAKWRNENDK